MVFPYFCVILQAKREKLQQLTRFIFYEQTKTFYFAGARPAYTVV